MISREQADVISDQFLGIEKNIGALKIDIPRSGQNVLLPVLMAPLFLGSLRHDAEDIVAWVWAAIGIFYTALLLLAVYQKRTPLIKIDGETWIYYGYYPWQRKYFLMHTIIKVTLSPVLNTWRKAYSFTIQTNDGKYHLWISNKQPSMVRQLRQMLVTNLNDKFSEIYA